MLRTLNVSLVSNFRLKVVEGTLGTCISCREKRKTIVQSHIRSIPEERKTMTQLDGLDLTQLQPQYRHIEALKDAPAEVRKIFSLKFGDMAEKLESRYLDYAEKLQRHKHDHDSPEMQVAKLTIQIRNLQEERTRMSHEPTGKRRSLLSKIKLRNDLLLELKSQNYEKYCLTMKVIDLKIFHGPEYDFPISVRAVNVADMRTRAFAEIERQKHQKDQRSKEVSQLQSEILEKLKSGELQPPEDESQA